MWVCTCMITCQSLFCLWLMSTTYVRDILQVFHLWSHVRVVVCVHIYDTGCIVWVWSKGYCLIEPTASTVSKSSYTVYICHVCRQWMRFHVFWSAYLCFHVSVCVDNTSMLPHGTKCSAPMTFVCLSCSASLCCSHNFTRLWPSKAVL